MALRESTGRRVKLLASLFLCLFAAVPGVTGAGAEQGGKGKQHLPSTGGNVGPGLSGEGRMSGEGLGGAGSQSGNERNDFGLTPDPAQNTNEDFWERIQQLLGKIDGGERSEERAVPDPKTDFDNSRPGAGNEGEGLTPGSEGCENTGPSSMGRIGTDGQHELAATGGTIGA